MSENTFPRRKILMLIPQLGYGGAETSFVRLSNLLAQHYDVTIALFTRHYDSKGYSNAGLEPDSPIILLDQFESSSSWFVRWINRWRTFRELKRTSDVAISFLTGPNLLNAIVGQRKKTIVCIQGSRMYDPNMRWFLRKLYLFFLDPVVYSLSKRVIGVSLGLVNEIPESLHGKFRVIEPFINYQQMIASTTDDIETEIAGLKGQAVIVAAGRLSEEKGFAPLIDIFAKLTTLIPNAKLLIIGDGPLRGSLETQCASLGLLLNNFDSNVTSVILAGYRENPLRYFRVSSVFVLSSLTEGFPNILIEALASGVLLMAANAPWGARSVLYNTPPDLIYPYPTEKPEMADYGLLMPRIDSLRYKQIWVDKFYEVLSNPDAYAELAKRGPERVRQLDQRIIGRKWLDLIEEVCAHDAQSSV